MLKQAVLNLNLNQLLLKLRDPNPTRLNYEFVRRRVQQMWGRWTEAAQSLLMKQPYLTERPVKHVRIFVVLHLYGL